MDENKEYVDLENLRLYDTLVKEYIEKKISEAVSFTESNDDDDNNIAPTFIEI